MSEISDKFNLHKERRLRELHQRMRDSKLYSSRKFKY
jgi:hypothetical protein